MENEELIQHAIEARKLTHSPYSKFPVGAVVLMKDGKIFQGANLENASYPLCMCAERIAIYSAYMAGYKKNDFVSLTVVADTEEPCSPCGACRQVISELFPSDGKIIMANMNGKVKTSTINELLPDSFSEKDLAK